MGFSLSPGSLSDKAAGEKGFRVTIQSDGVISIILGKLGLGIWR